MVYGGRVSYTNDDYDDGDGFLQYTATNYHKHLLNGEP